MRLFDQRRKRIFLFSSILILGLLWLSLTDYQATLSKDSVVVDFIAYWASGRLLLAGGNPYSSEGIVAVQKSAGWTKETPLVMYSPPWALTFILPFSLKNYTAAKWLWLIFILTILIICSHLLWRLYEGTAWSRLRSLLLFFSFAPILFVILKGQFVPLILLGVAGFLHFTQRRQYFLAGLCTGLMAIKPHSLYLFWIALLLCGINKRRWSLLLGALGGTVVLSIIPLIFNPEILSLYLGSVVIGESPFLNWLTPTIGTFLRLLSGRNLAWVQFIPTVIGMICFPFYWYRRRKQWSWSEEMPIIIFLSLGTTFYVWVNDFALMIVAVFHSQVLSMEKIPAKYIGLYVSINVLSWAIFLILVNEQWFVWMVPILYLLYTLLRSANDKALHFHAGPGAVRGGALNQGSYGGSSV